MDACLAVEPFAAGMNGEQTGGMLVPDRYICLQTEHVRKFRCDGAECQSKCCKGWDVQIDDGSRKKYKKIKKKDARKRILSFLTQKEDGWQIEFPSDGKCPFLRQDGLCELQHDWGESYLSPVCRTYPRNIIRIGDRMEQSLLLSCPVAARLVLGQRAPMEFEQVEAVLERPMFVRSAPWEEGLRHLPDLQYAAISLLQNRRLTIDGRLALLGFLMEQLQDADGQQQWDALVKFYTSEDVGDQTAEILCQIRFAPEVYLRMIFGLMEDLYGPGSEVHAWDGLLQHVVRVFGFEDSFEVPLKNLAESYEKRCLPMKAIMMERYEHVFENYLVNEFFGNIYPFRVNGNFAENYGTFLLGYKLLEFLLSAMMADRGDKAVDEGVLVACIVNFATKLDHSPEFLECVSEESRKQGGKTKSFWQGLLQDAVRA